jgi:hypothetical protein
MKPYYDHLILNIWTGNDSSTGSDGTDSGSTGSDGTDSGSTGSNGSVSSRGEGPLEHGQPTILVHVELEHLGIGASLRPPPPRVTNPCRYMNDSCQVYTKRKAKKSREQEQLSVFHDIASEEYGSHMPFCHKCIVFSIPGLRNKYRTIASTFGSI